MSEIREDGKLIDADYDWIQVKGPTSTLIQFGGGWQIMETAPRHDDGSEILTWDGMSMRVASYAYDDRWRVSGLPSFVPTYWMPLPEPPK